MYEYDLSGVFDEPNESNHAVAVQPPEVVFLDEQTETSDEKETNTSNPIAGVGIDTEEIRSLHQCDSSDVFDEPNENNHAVAANQAEVVFLEEPPGTSDESQKLTSFKMEDVATSLDEAAGYYSEDSDVVEVTAYFLEYE